MGSRRLLSLASAAISGLLCACASTSSPPPNVVIPPPGETPDSIPGPMPNFGPFASVEDALMAACPLVMSQPDAIIPVPKTDDNFKLYWNTSREYCAWLYSPDGKKVEMTLLAASAVQNDPGERHCDLPAHVSDTRYSADALLYLVIMHSHPVDEDLSTKDLRFLNRMARLHGLTRTVNGKPVSMSIVAFVGRFNFGKPTCSSYYQYLPAGDDLVRKMVADGHGGWTAERLGRIRWDKDGPHLER